MTASVGGGQALGMAADKVETVIGEAQARRGLVLGRALNRWEI
jgi:hypothetical protein